MRPLICLLFALLTAIGSAQADWFDEREKKFVAGLRARQLLDIAETYCLQSLERADITATDQAALTVELMQCRATQALIAATDQKPSAWQSVWQTERDFDSKFPAHPQRILVTIQTALSRLSYAASIQQELSAEMIAPAAVQSARQNMIDQLRQSRRTFEQVERDIDRMLPEQRAQSPTEARLSVDQLSIMRSNVRYQLAKCNLQTAYGYDVADTVNRTSIITDVLQRLSEVQNSVSPQQRLWWLAKITQIQCLRLLGRHAEGWNVLNGLPEQQRPADLASAILAQRLLLAVARTDVAWAQKHLQQSAGQRLSDQSPEMDVAQMKAAVMLSNNATSSPDRQRWLDRAAQIVNGIETIHGAYWSRRAGLSLIEATGSSAGLDNNQPSAGQRAILVRTAQRAAANGNDEDALRAWRRAIELTPPGVDRQRLQINASKILEGLKRNREAAQMLLAGATEQPTSEIAAAMHLRGCWNMAQTHATTDLVASLDQHIQQWPESPTTEQAAIWLAVEYNRQTDFDRAIATLTDLQRPISTNIVRQLRATFYLIQTHSGTDSGRITQLAKRIVNHLQYHAANVSDISIAQSLTTTSAEIALLSGCLNLADVGKILTRHQTRFPAGQQSSVTLYGSVLKALLDEDLPAATGLLETASPSEPDCRKLMSIVKAQMKFNAPIDANQSSIHNRYMLSIVARAQTRPLSIQQTTAWKFEQAKLLRATKQYKRALPVLTSLAQQFRSDAAIQLEYARALTESGDRAADALKAWRVLAQQLEPKTENWYEAKFNVGQALADAGQRDQAKKLLRYVEALHGWNGSKWAEPIKALLRKL
jgi:tetratricopeptide (TPR) repeat protein